MAPTPIGPCFSVAAPSGGEMASLRPAEGFPAGSSAPNPAAKVSPNKAAPRNEVIFFMGVAIYSCIHARKSLAVSARPITPSLPDQ